jgi:hypothetical protein
MNFGANDPVYVVQAISDMILSITGTVYDTIEFGMDFNGTMTSKERDNLNLCAVYIDMGIITITTDFLAGYGAAAAETPTFLLKGSGDIVLKADSTKEFYVTKAVVGGSPAGAVHEKIASVQFGIKLLKTGADLVTNTIQVIKDTKSVAKNEEEEPEEL